MYQRTHKSFFHPKTLLHRLVWIKKKTSRDGEIHSPFLSNIWKKNTLFLLRYGNCMYFWIFLYMLRRHSFNCRYQHNREGERNTNKKYKSVSERCYKGCDKGWNIGTIYKECVRGACICSYQGSKNPLYYTKYTINRE